MNKLIIYGGTFNPCTSAHYNAMQCARNALMEKGCTVIGLFMPTGDKYIKSNKIPASARCEMIEKMISEFKDDSIKLCRYEVESSRQPRTIHTLDYIQSQALDWEIYFLLGADKLSQFDRWHKAEEILKKYHLIVLNRNGKNKSRYDLNEILQNDLLKKYADKILIAENRNAFYDEISSTLIRNRFYQASESVLEKWLPLSVIEYIRTNHLYTENTETEPLKIALGQMKVIPGNPSANFEKMKQMISQAKQKQADIIVFPEMCVGGYMLADKWCDEAFCRYLINFNEKIRELSDEIGIIWGNLDSDDELSGHDGRRSRLNCAFFAYNKKWCRHKGSFPLLRAGREIKTLNPDYRIFDDSRYFLSSHEVSQQLMDHPESEKLIDPFLFKKNGREYIVGLEICEDMWSMEYNSVNPTSLLAEANCDFIVNISASPWNLSKEKARQERILQQVDECGSSFCPFIYVNAVGMQNNGKNILMFDGDSCAYDKYGHLLLSCRDDFKEDLQILDFKNSSLKVKRPQSEKLLDCLINAIKEFDLQQFNGKTKWIIGLSGGLDSSINAALLTMALGSDRIVGYNLATKHNSDTTKNNAQSLADKLNIPIRNGSIEKVVESTIETCYLYGYEDQDITSLAQENIQARIRGHLLSSFAQIENAVICNNGNKIEVALGYCTLYGDTIGCLSPLGDCTKVQLFELANLINQRFNQEVIPLNLLPEIQDKQIVWKMPPSAELKDAQKDPMKWFYHDWLISQLIENPKSGAEKILSMYLDGSIYKSEAGKWLHYYGLDADPNAFIEDIEWVLKQISRSVFKRIQMPPIITISQRSFGFDFRENQTNYEQTNEFRQLKAKILNL